MSTVTVNVQNLGAAAVLGGCRINLPGDHAVILLHDGLDAAEQETLLDELMYEDEFAVFAASIPEPRRSVEGDLPTAV